MTQAQRYIENVLSGREVVCELTCLAVKRHLADLERQGDPDFPFVFDERHAQRVLDFFRTLRHTAGKHGGQKFNLQDNQAFALYTLFGWRRLEGGRRFTQCYWEMARKSGKSQKGGGIELYTGFFEGERGAEVFTAATTREQANEVFKAVKEMAKYMRQDSPVWRKQIEVRANSVNFLPTNSFIQKVSSDADNLDGKNPQCAVIDEYHAHKNDRVKGVMQTGMGSRDTPLLLIITTAGFDKDSPCYKVERANAVAVLKGERRQDNLFVLIFTQDEGEAEIIMGLDPDIPEEAAEILRLAKKSNPNLGSTPTERYLLDQVRDARNKGASTRVQVLTKNFNVWMDAPKIWIPEEEIKAVMRPVATEEFRGRTVYMGLDLAAKLDLTALALYAPAEQGKKALLKLFFWLPEDTVEKRASETSYREWVQDGHIQTTPGNIFDQGFACAKILELQGQYGVREICYDPWNAYQTALYLVEKGIDVKECRPSYANHNEPIGRLETGIVGDEIEIDFNPVLLWNFRNVALDFNADESRKLNKKRSIEKVDGVSAAVTAIFGWLTEEAAPSSYLLSPEFEKALE